MDICAFITYICGISIILNSQILLILVISICDICNSSILINCNLLPVPVETAPPV